MRAAYGKQVIRRLSEQLTERFGKGFSVLNLQLFRQFYLAYSGTDQIYYTACNKLKIKPERKDWRPFGFENRAIAWDSLDEHISVEGLLDGRPSSESPQSIQRWLLSRGHKCENEM